MPTFEDPVDLARKAQQAMLGLARTTRTTDDPRHIYSILGSLSAAAVSLSQSLHQIASFHDGSERKTSWMTGDSRAGRATAFQVSWDLHRAGEILKQVAESIDHAQEAEATIAYDHRDYPGLVAARRADVDPGIGL